MYHLGVGQFSGFNNSLARARRSFDDSSVATGMSLPFPSSLPQGNGGSG
jgi:hypothetical protein